MVPMLLSRRLGSPFLHAWTRLGSEILAEEFVKPLDDRERVLLKRREMDIEKAMLVACVAEGDQPVHAELPRIGIELSEIHLVDVVRKGASQFVITIVRRRNHRRDIAMSHPDACVREHLIECVDEDDVRRVLEAPPPWRATPLE